MINYDFVADISAKAAPDRGRNLVNLGANTAEMG
jgi:hypothetical protein